MALGIYAGSSVNGMVALPSPVSLKTSLEFIWHEDTGRAQSGTNKAEMIGEVVAEKKTYNIQWGILTQSELDTITGKLVKSYFYIGVGTSLNNAKSNAIHAYRGNITYTALPIGSTTYYKDVTVDVIEK